MITKEIDKYLRMPIEHFFQNFENCTRIANAFREREEFHVFNIVEKDIYNIRKIPRLGPACIDNIISELSLKGLSLGMDLTGFDFNALPSEEDFEGDILNNENTHAESIFRLVESLVEIAFAPCREYAKGLLLDEVDRAKLLEITKNSLNYKIDCAVHKVKF